MTRTPILTDRQKKFSELLVYNEGKMSPAECANEAGYKTRPRQSASELRNPKVYPGCEIFVPFEEKVPLADRFSEAFTKSLDKIVMFSTLATTTLTTIFLVKNLKD